MTTMQSHAEREFTSPTLMERSVEAIRTIGASSLAGVLRRSGERIAQAHVGFEARMGRVMLSREDIQKGADDGTFDPQVRDWYLQHGYALPYFEAHPDRTY